jgi:hypothetical protein
MRVSFGQQRHTHTKAQLLNYSADSEKKAFRPRSPAASQEDRTTTDNCLYDDLIAVPVWSSMSGKIDILSGLWLDDRFASTDSTGSAALLSDALDSTIGLVNSSRSEATRDARLEFLSSPVFRHGGANRRG